MHSLAVPAFPIDPRPPLPACPFSIELFFVPPASTAHTAQHTSTFNLVVPLPSTPQLNSPFAFCASTTFAPSTNFLGSHYPYTPKDFPQILNFPNQSFASTTFLHIPNQSSKMATTAMDYENANGDRFDGMSTSSTASSPFLYPVWPLRQHLAPAPAPDADADER